ncbi:STAS domain-containing protein [Actinomadura graeca]|uniref:STAS domain-containing protein n=1 Tax=Actinomadura graeca TaxID=2750812 RepID=A0ABX8QTT3_9ACTN|nr:STAS domain-containing protein [Actinomadura graeca]QXJ21604.1 STAS domain-containing protein [Actinomadura graeca]
MRTWPGRSAARAPRPEGEERMTVWRITGGEGGPVPRPAPRYDRLELDTALLRIASASGSSWLRLTGDVDVSNAPALSRALRAAEARAPGDVHLDLAGVDFIDVAGLRAITKAARDLDERECMLVLHSVSPHLDKLVRLIGWDATPGLLTHCRARQSP